MAARIIATLTDGRTPVIPTEAFEEEVRRIVGSGVAGETDREMRSQALESAVRTSGTVAARVVLEKAREFYAFLKGEPSCD